MDDSDTDSYNIHFYLSSSNTNFRALIGCTFHPIASSCKTPTLSA